MALAAAIHASPACRLVGIETYEGQGATGDSAADKAYADTLMQRVCGIALACDQQGLFDSDEVLMTAGGSAIFDLVSGWLTPKLSNRCAACCVRAATSRTTTATTSAWSAPSMPPA
jgi:D-serine dehydratase